MKRAIGLMPFLLVLFLGWGMALAGPIGLDGRLRSTDPRPAQAPPTTFNPPFMYDPHEEIYDWKIKDHPEIPPCYYDEYYGQWFGDCDLYLTAPGYSVTIPSRIQR